MLLNWTSFTNSCPAICFLGFDDGFEKFQFEARKDEYPIPDDIKEGDVVTITFSHRGRVWVVPLYIRQDWVDQLAKLESFMNNDRKRKLYVTGAQGCGKTCFLWMWARMLMKRGRRVLLILKMDLSIIQVLEDGATWQLTPPVGTTQLIETLTALLKAQTRQFDVCICSGVRLNDDTSSMLMSVLCEGMLPPSGKISKLIFEAALLFRIPLGDEVSGQDSVVDEMTLDSWLEADYEKAALSDLMKDPKLRGMLLADWVQLTSDFKTVDAIFCGDKECENAEQPGDADKIIQAVRLKFYYAGGCARFMFDMPLDRLQVEVHKFIEGQFTWVPFSLYGLTNVQFDNVMQLCSDGKKSRRVPVSKYVMLQGYEYGRSGLTNAIKSVAWETRSALLNGWAFELSQFDTIRSALEANTDIRRSNDSWVAVAVDNGRVTFCPTAEATFDGSRIREDVASATVIWSSCDWNQGCFDAAAYFDATVVTFQFAATGPRLLKVGYMKPLRSALLAKGVDVKRMVHMVIGDEYFLKEAVSQWQGPSGNSDDAIRVELTTSAGLSSKLVPHAINSINPGDNTHDFYVNL